MSAAELPHYAYLSLITFPDGYAGDDVAQLLADAGVQDLKTLQIMLGRPPPIVLGRFEQQAARDGVNSMLRAGGDAFAPTLEDLQALGGTLKVKHLELIDDGFQFELWRGGAIEIIWRREVQVLVRAQIRSSTSKMVTDTGRLSMSGSVAMASPGIGLAMASTSGSTSHLKREHSQSDKLDIHMADGRVFQLDGDKFGYGVLGDMRSATDSQNMDKMLELMTHLVPNAIVDQYFSLFKPPTGYKKLRLPMMQINNEDRAFAFYSRWAALMYRHVMSAR